MGQLASVYNSETGCSKFQQICCFSLNIQYEIFKTDPVLNTLGYQIQNIQITLTSSSLGIWNHSPLLQSSLFSKNQWIHLSHSTAIVKRGSVFLHFWSKTEYKVSRRVVHIGSLAAAARVVSLDKKKKSPLEPFPTQVHWLNDRYGWGHFCLLCTQLC